MSLKPKGHPGMSPMRMGHPGRMPGPMNAMHEQYSMRGPPPNGSMGPGGPMPPMSMSGPGQRTPGPWPPSSTGVSPGPPTPMSQMMNYSSPSPGNFNGPPGTPIMPSPQGSTGPYSPASHRVGVGRRDSTNSGDTNMYMGMKPGMSGPMGPGFPMGGPDGPMGPMGPEGMPPVMNGMNGDGMEGMKHSPHNGPGTPREDMPPVSGPSDMPGYNPLPYQDPQGGSGPPPNGPPGPPPNGPPGQQSHAGGLNDQTESAAILKIKESMAEEAKRFEKDTPGDPSHPDYPFMQ